MSARGRAALSSSSATASTGARLVKAAVAWARAEKMQIVALCPFAKSVFDRTPEYGDVLKK
ncbi:MAG: GNAT family N-acetyltransferase [Betaproteobacteria bacterium]